MEEIIKPYYRWNPDTGTEELCEYKTGRWSFTEDDKIRLVSEYVSGNMPASQFIEKHHISSRQTLFNWMDRYINENELLSLPEKQDNESMVKRSDEEIRELKAENERLRKALELEKLRSKAFDTMISVAEDMFNIPIRKKAGTKR